MKRTHTGYPTVPHRYNPYRNATPIRGMNDSVKIVAGATTTMVGIGTIGALGIGAMGLLKP